jgi:FlaA1/EpsC-like NDP-sugar epimerase
MREALANCRAAGVQVKTIPGFGEILANKNRRNPQLRDISVDDLLGHEPVHLEEERIRQCIEGRTVLVAGAAGSIGSELCRQIARFQPGRLILLDRAESALFSIDTELRRRCGSLNIAPEIGDIRDYLRIEDILTRHNVDSVFHAAFYKNVPLMEMHVLEAVQNNVIGTWNLVEASYKHGVSTFLMLSSDKAVKPSSVSGATKRAAELIVGANRPAPPERGSRFASVRLGNTLGSRGSVVPLFRAQIAAGGPVTVTHPDVRRCFMSITEAAQLVLQASTMTKGSVILVLEPGEPMRILDLARNMIRLAGLVPDEDIELEIVGLRPGEKLVEDVVMGAGMVPTTHEKIRILQESNPAHAQVESWIKQLEILTARRNPFAVVTHLKHLVPEYLPYRARTDGINVQLPTNATN